MGMKRAIPLWFLLSLLLLSITIIPIFPSSAQSDQTFTIVITDTGPSIAVLNQPTALEARVLLNSTTYGTVPAKGQVVFLVDGAVITQVTTDDTGYARTVWEFNSSGTHTVTTRVTVPIAGMSTVKEWAVSVSSAAAPTSGVPTTAPQATAVTSTSGVPTTTPQATAGKSTVTPNGWLPDLGGFSANAVTGMAGIAFSALMIGIAYY